MQMSPSVQSDGDVESTASPVSESSSLAFPPGFVFTGDVDEDLDRLEQWEEAHQVCLIASRADSFAFDFSKPDCYWQTPALAQQQLMQRPTSDKPDCCEATFESSMISMLCLLSLAIHLIAPLVHDML